MDPLVDLPITGCAFGSFVAALFPAQQLCGCRSPCPAPLAPDIRSMLKCMRLNCRLVDTSSGKALLPELLEEVREVLNLVFPDGGSKVGSWQYASSGAQGSSGWWLQLCKRAGGGSCCLCARCAAAVLPCVHVPQR